jgi:hypothetical protein
MTFHLQTVKKPFRFHIIYVGLCRYEPSKTGCLSIHRIRASL